MFERRNQAPSCPGVRKLQPGNSRKQYRSSSSTPFDSALHSIPQGSEDAPSRVVTLSHKITPSKRKGNSWQSLRPGHPAQGGSAKRHARPEDSEGPPGEFRWRERLRTRTSVRDETLERQLDRQTGPQRRAVSLALQPAKPITSCPCRRPGLLQRERRGRDRPWGSR